jgi:hypothetical protein
MIDTQAAEGDPTGCMATLPIVMAPPGIVITVEEIYSAA